MAEFSFNPLVDDEDDEIFLGPITLREIKKTLFQERKPEGRRPKSMFVPCMPPVSERKGTLATTANNTSGHTSRDKDESMNVEESSVGIDTQSENVSAHYDIYDSPEGSQGECSIKQRKSLTEASQSAYFTAEEDTQDLTQFSEGDYEDRFDYVSACNVDDIPSAEEDPLYEESDVSEEDSMSGVVNVPNNTPDFSNKSTSDELIEDVISVSSDKTNRSSMQQAILLANGSEEQVEKVISDNAYSHEYSVLKKYGTPSKILPVSDYTLDCSLNSTMDNSTGRDIFATHSDCKEVKVNDSNCKDEPIAGDVYFEEKPKKIACKYVNIERQLDESHECLIMSKNDTQSKVLTMDENSFCESIMELYESVSASASNVKKEHVLSEYPQDEKYESPSNVITVPDNSFEDISFSPTSETAQMDNLNLHSHPGNSYPSEMNNFEDHEITEIQSFGGANSSYVSTDDSGISEVQHDCSKEILPKGKDSFTQAISQNEDENLKKMSVEKFEASNLLESSVSVDKYCPDLSPVQISCARESSEKELSIEVISLDESVNCSPKETVEGEKFEPFFERNLLNLQNWNSDVEINKLSDTNKQYLMKISSDRRISRTIHASEDNTDHNVPADCENINTSSEFNDTLTDIEKFLAEGLKKMQLNGSASSPSDERKSSSPQAYFHERDIECQSVGETTIQCDRNVRIPESSRRVSETKSSDISPFNKHTQVQRNVQHHLTVPKQVVKDMLFVQPTSLPFENKIEKDMKIVSTRYPKQKVLNFDDIISPVGEYIRSTPTTPLIRNVRPRNVNRVQSVVVKNKTPSPYLSQLVAGRTPSPYGGGKKPDLPNRNALSENVATFKSNAIERRVVTTEKPVKSDKSSRLPVPVQFSRKLDFQHKGIQDAEIENLDPEIKPALPIKTYRKAPSVTVAGFTPRRPPYGKIKQLVPDPSPIVIKHTGRITRRDAEAFGVVCAANNSASDSFLHDSTIASGAEVSLLEVRNVAHTYTLDRC